jgi:hypothetical protein
MPQRSIASHTGAMACPAAIDTAIRELGHGTNDAISVTLFCDADTDRTFVAVEDHHSNDWFTVEVHGRHALDAFQHPHAYR